jgi:hypothetical protein
MDGFSEDLIGYDAIVNDSMRMVIHNILKKIEKQSNLPGQHYFVITFDTTHKNVILSGKIKAIYKESITIILQKQFLITKITPKYFDVELSFSGVIETVRIPFEAIQEFTDPYINFSLKFDSDHLDDDEFSEFQQEYYAYEKSITAKKEKTTNVISIEEARNNLKK